MSTCTSNCSATDIYTYNTLVYTRIIAPSGTHTSHTKAHPRYARQRKLPDDDDGGAFTYAMMASIYIHAAVSRLV